MLSLRERKKEETRRALSRAAAELLLAEGTENMTVAAIAEKAGVSTRTFHNYFPRREDALLLFIENTLDDWSRQVEDAPEDEHPADTMHRLIGDRLSDGTHPEDAPEDAPENPGTLLSLMTIGDHLSAVAGVKEKARVQHVADGLLEALYRRPGHGMSRQGVALLLISSLAAGALAVEPARQKSSTAECGSIPSWAWPSSGPQDAPSRLEESFRLLRAGFGG
ncbi:TetR/AcrR family transcriptional regulator [Corynebacterium variabile]|uniref:TetR/AcrR family transcriptional regulator n=1 Tax=Corynebacterium variabile TaxID=1727 RepID=UPI0035E42A39